MSQTAYAIEAAVAFEGMLADPAGGPTRRSLSRANEDAAASFFGRGVTYGTDPDTQFALPSATGAELAGVTVHRHGTQVVTDDGLAQNEVGELLRGGRIWVLPEDAVTPESDVFWRHTTGGAGEVIGQFRSDADTAQADQVTNARWLTSGGPATPAMLEINLP